jgi:sugar phosphate permease
MGVLTASSATGQLVFLPVLAAIVERFGWRSVVLTVAAVAAAIIPLVLIFVQDRPEAVGLRPYGERGAAAPVARTSGNPIATAFRALAEAGRSRDFWLLFASFYVCGASTNGLIGTHLIAACLDHGIPEVQSAGLLAAMGMFDLIGTTASGWLSDRWSGTWVGAGRRSRSPFPSTSPCSA